MFINRKLVLGLDLGVGSIGWCLVSKDLQDNPLEIVAIGSRVVPLSTTEVNDFKVGKSKSPSQQKRLVKSFRRNIDRYQMRRYKGATDKPCGVRTVANPKLLLNGT